MVLTSLGTQVLDLPYAWTSFQAIDLSSARQYLLEVAMTSQLPDLIYSNFIFRYRYPDSRNVVAASPELGVLSFDSGLQMMPFTIPRLLANSGALIIQVRRVPYYSQLSSLASVECELFIDPSDSVHV